MNLRAGGGRRQATARHRPGPQDMTEPDRVTH